MARKCPECREPMVPVSSAGKPDPEGGYLACPRALAENTPAAFSESYKRRSHREPRLFESYAHARARRAAAKKAQLALLPEEAGRKPQKRMEQ